MRRISTKLTAAAGIAIALVMTVHAILRLDRESEAFHEDLRGDHLVLGYALAETTATLIERLGPTEAMRAVEEADRRRDHVQIRWLPEAVPAMSAADETVGGETFFVTRVPVETSRGPRGVIELRESLAPLAEYAGQTVWRVAGVTLLTVLACAALVHVTGWWILDRRLRGLVAGIRRIGGGDLDAPLPLAGDDELGVLASEIEDMRSRLAALQRTAEAETDARLAALEQVRHADRLSTVGKLAAGVAHELGTPLNVVAARAKMIRTGESEPDEVTDDARVIGEQAERMTRIIRQMLEFARPRPPERAEHDVREIAVGVLGMLRSQANAAGIEASVTTSEPVVAFVDAMQLQQVLINLVMNAIQAQPDGGVVEIAVSSQDRELLVEVRDRGPGLGDEARERLFEPFFTTKQVGQGTGLGLSVVHGIVQEHGGTITVDEADGTGTVFRVRLPRSEAA